jgi:hypothetical protein
VTTRFDAAGLETLDTLIAVGIAADRAQAIRWAVDRIRADFPERTLLAPRRSLLEFAAAP